MVSHCANPPCSVPLRYLREGRLYQFEVRPLRSAQSHLASSRGKKLLRQVWHYWLCGRCASSMTLTFDQIEGLKVVPLRADRSTSMPAYPRADLPPELAG